MATSLETNTKRVGPYRDGLAKTVANYAPLSPLSFLPKAATIYPDRIAIVHGQWRSTWAETYARCRRLASALHEAWGGYGRYGRRNGAQCSRDLRGAFRRADDGRGAEHAERPARRRSNCFPAHARRSKSDHHRPRIQRSDQTRAGTAGAPAIGDRHRRPSARGRHAARGNGLRNVLEGRRFCFRLVAFPRTSLVRLP